MEIIYGNIVLLPFQRVWGILTWNLGDTRSLCNNIENRVKIPNTFILDVEDDMKSNSIGHRSINHYY